MLRDAKVFGFEAGVLPCELIQEVRIIIIDNSSLALRNSLNLVALVAVTL